jgi:hypothetical protein
MLFDAGMLLSSSIRTEITLLVVTAHQLIALSFLLFRFSLDFGFLQLLIVLMSFLTGSVVPDFK